MVLFTTATYTLGWPPVSISRCFDLRSNLRFQIWCVEICVSLLVWRCFERRWGITVVVVWCCFCCVCGGEVVVMMRGSGGGGVMVVVPFPCHRQSLL